jgi:hypothetical protein
LPDPNERIYRFGFSFYADTAVFFRRKAIVGAVIPPFDSDNDSEAFNPLHPRNVYMRYTVTADTNSIHG